MRKNKDVSKAAPEVIRREPIVITDTRGMDRLVRALDRANAEIAARQKIAIDPKASDD